METARKRVRDILDGNDNPEVAKHMCLAIVANLEADRQMLLESITKLSEKIADGSFYRNELMRIIAKAKGETNAQPAPKSIGCEGHGVEITVDVSEVDGATVVFVDTPDDPPLRINLNDEPVWENPPYPAS